MAPAGPQSTVSAGRRVIRPRQATAGPGADAGPAPVLRRVQGDAGEDNEVPPIARPSFGVKSTFASPSLRIG